MKLIKGFCIPIQLLLHMYDLGLYKATVSFHRGHVSSIVKLLDLALAFSAGP